MKPAIERLQAWFEDAIGRVSLLLAGDAERGQGLAEYALILALIIIVAVVALIFLGGQVKTIISSTGGSV